MKLIEKTCPKCGANLKFNKNDEKVVCEYCKKEFLIEQDDDNNDYYLYSSDVGKAILKGSFFTIFFISILVIMMVILVMFGIRSCDVTKKINNLDDISESTRKEVHNDSKNILNNYMIMNMKYKQVESFKNIGFYLFIDGDENTLYDIYKGVYEIDGSNKDVYAAVKYENIKNGNSMVFGKMVGDFSGFDSKFKYGYESNEELYNYLISITSYKKVFATSNLYTK